ncbi:MAG: DNA-binding response regulator [Spirochaetaceae bacterium]|nr:MAG: DNA-binding response regulator [Spirochaetaceae bacterium]
MSVRTVILVDDHPPLRAGVATILEATGHYRVVSQVGAVADALRAAGELSPDILVVDISLPDGSGIDLVRSLRSTGCPGRILVLSMHAIRRLADEAIDAGADGYLLKESTGEHLMAALESICDGRTFIDARLRSLGASIPADQPAREAGTLTGREYQVFVQIASGRNSKEIGALLGISPKTVDNHRAAVIEKLGVSSVAELVRIAIRTGAIVP